MGIYKTGVWSEGSIYERTLPEGYTELEYIISNGSQYIDTGVDGNNINLKIEVTYEPDSVATSQMAVYSARTSSSSGISFWRDGWAQFGGASVQVTGMTITGKHTAILSRNGLIFDGVRINYTPGSTFVSTNLILGKVPSDNRVYIGKIFNFKVYDNGVLIRNMIPTLRNSDNVAGMYDIVTKTFFTNSGTGEFKYVLKGMSSDVFSQVPEEYSRLDYIQSNGAQWIDTGVHTKNGNKVIADLEFISLGNTAIFGTYTGDYLATFGLSASNKWEYRDSLSWRTASQTAALNTRYTIEFVYGLNSQYLKVNNTNVISNTYILSTNTSSVNAALFARKTSGIECLARIKLYNFQFWEDENTLTRNFIPVKRKSDNVIGMYDIVNNVFYTNNGSSTFSAGSPYLETANVKIFKEENKIEANSFIEI